FRIVFVVCVFIGSVITLSTVIDFADAMLLSMALPNIIGGVILAPMVRRRLKTYWSKYRGGDMQPGEVVAPIPRDDLGADI
ncbi:MAG: alanine:cation symporter family protein, partial [Planctomycetota bacterium]